MNRRSFFAFILALFVPAKAKPWSVNFSDGRLDYFTEKEVFEAFQKTRNSIIQ